MSLYWQFRNVCDRGPLLGTVTILLLAGCGRQLDPGPVANLSAAKSIRSVLVKAEELEESGEASGTTSGTGWATIRGQFLYGGDPTTIQLRELTEVLNHDDRAICAPGGKPPRAETLVVDSATRGIKNVAIYLRSASRVHDSAASPPSEPVVFDQQHCVFLTRVFGVTVGQKVEVKNSDPTGHNTKVGGKNSFNQTIPRGESIIYEPQKEEALPTPITCSIHPWMIAYMLPRQNGYYAVTDEQGQFEIANVPAGEELEFQVWHESGAASGNGLVGQSDDAALKWDNRGRVRITLQPDEVKEFKITVPPTAFRG